MAARASRAPSVSAKQLIGRYAVVLVLLAMIALFSLLRPETFFTGANFRSILVTESALVILAIGITVPLATGEFDLSIASMLGFAAGFLAWLTVVHEMNVVLAVALTFGCGLVVGLANAVFVVGFGVNSFIATLAMGTLVSGLALAVFGAETIAGIPPAITDFANVRILGLSLVFYLALALALVLWYVLEHTPLGRYILFSGEGREAARLSGVRVDRIRVGALVASSLMATLAGVILLSQTGAAQGSFGQPFLLPAYAAAFLGATTIKPGHYNALGTVVAVFLLAVGTTGLQQLGAADWVNDVFNGVSLLVAVTAARMVWRGN
jgi:ribose transport system permease protein